MEHIYREPQFGEDWFSYPTLYSRFVKELNSGSKIIEVGCWKGKSAAYLAVEIINSGKDIKLDAVDIWECNDQEYNIKYSIQDDPYIKSNSLYELFLSNISPVSSVVHPIRMKSTEASKLYEDESVDVVFIDAAHDYESVRDDIKCWYPKVKPGGYLAGHDYAWTGVSKAVNEVFGNGVENTELCWVFKKPVM